MRERGFPIWALGVLGGLLLVLLLSRTSLGPSRDRLKAQFAARPGDTSAGSLPSLPSLGQLPPVAQAAQATASALLGRGSQAPALTPVASSASLRVQIDSLAREQGGVRVRGSLTNTGQAPRDVPTEALQFRDGAGQLYASNGPAVSLAPGASAAIDLTVPAPEGSSLALIVDLPPDPPLELALLAR